MKTKNELQEDNETRRYILKHQETGEILHISETFHYYSKRGQVFPAQYSRTGRQYIEVCDENGTIIAYDCNRNVYESSTERKKNIFKLLRDNISDLKDFENILIDKVPRLNCLVDCVELVKSFVYNYIYNNIKQANEDEETPGIVEIIFNHQLSSKLTERLKEALANKAITYRFEENKKLYIKYLS